MPHGPIFPYRFSFDFCGRFYGKKPSDVPLGQCLCRWALSNPDRALEWNDQGKGKGVTILSSDGPERCCSHRTPQLFLQNRIAEDLERLIPGPGRIYRAYIAGHGWYTADPGTDYFIRLVTNKQDVPLLREEAVIYDQELPETSREPLRMKGKNTDETFAFHGFFQTDARDAAAIVFEFIGPLPEGYEKDEKPRKKRKKKHRGNP